MKYLYAFLFLSLTLHAQEPGILWQQRFGGSAWNASYDLAATPNGFAIGGRSTSGQSFDKSENSRGGFDFWILRTDADGVRQWDKTIGGASPGGEQDYFYGLAAIPGNGYVVCGSSNSPVSADKTEGAVSHSVDYWIVKLSETGTPEWQNVIGGSVTDIPYRIVATADGGYLLGGSSTSGVSGDKSQACQGAEDFWVVKIDAAGTILWQKTYGGSDEDVLTAITPCNDGGFLLSGSSASGISGNKTQASYGGSDFWAVRADSNGNVIWQKAYGGTGYDALWATAAAADGGFLLTGQSASGISGNKTESCRGNYDFWILRIDATGNIAWQRTIGGSNEDSPYEAIALPDGNWAVAGTTNSPAGNEIAEGSNGDFDGFVVKLSDTGAILWQKTIGGSGADGFNRVVSTNDGGLALSGNTASPVSGDITQSPKGISDYWLVRLAPDNLGLATAPYDKKASVSPNPTTSTVNVTLGNFGREVEVIVYDLSGRELKRQQFLDTLRITDLTVGDAPGIYTLCIVGSDGSRSLVKVVRI